MTKQLLTLFAVAAFCCAATTGCADAWTKMVRETTQADYVIVPPATQVGPGTLVLLKGATAHPLCFGNQYVKGGVPVDETNLLTGDQRQSKDWTSFDITLTQQEVATLKGKYSSTVSVRTRLTNGRFARIDARAQTPGLDLDSLNLRAITNPNCRSQISQLTQDDQKNVRILNAVMRYDVELEVQQNGTWSADLSAAEVKLVKEKIQAKLGAQGGSDESRVQTGKDLYIAFNRENTGAVDPNKLPQCSPAEKSSTYSMYSYWKNCAGGQRDIQDGSSGTTPISFPTTSFGPAYDDSRTGTTHTVCPSHNGTLEVYISHMGFTMTLPPKSTTNTPASFPLPDSPMLFENAGRKYVVYGTVDYADGLAYIHTKVDILCKP